MELVLLWCLFGIAGAAVLSRYNKAGIGCLLGLFLGPIGLLIAWTKRDDERLDEAQTYREPPVVPGPSDTRVERECPYCAERILAKAHVCKHCGRDVEPAA